MEEDKWWLMPYIDPAVETLSRPRNWVDPVLWPEGWAGNQQGQGDFRISDVPTWLLGLGRWPETADDAYRRYLRPMEELATDTIAERAAREAATQGGEAERRMRAIREQHKRSYLKSPTPAKDTKPEDEEDPTEDLLNQLLMSALMAGGKSGKQASLGGAAGGGISFGDPWKMRRDWERDYRYLQS